MNIKLVKFSNGKYGIRRGLIFHEYLDFRWGRWFSKDSPFFKQCEIDEKTARFAFSYLKTKEQVIE